MRVVGRQAVTVAVTVGHATRFILSLVVTHHIHSRPDGSLFVDSPRRSLPEIPWGQAGSSATARRPAGIVRSFESTLSPSTQPRPLRVAHHRAGVTAADVGGGGTPGGPAE